MNSGTEVIRNAGGFIDPAIDTEGARDDLQMYYCFSTDKVQVFSKVEDHLGEAMLTGQVNLADLDRLTPVKRVERVLSCEYEKKPVLVIVAESPEQHHVVFWFDIRSDSINLVVLDEPLKGQICAFHVMHSPMVVLIGEHEDKGLRHVLAFGMQDGSIRIVMIEYPIKEHIQTTSTLIPASDLDGSPVTALTLIPPAKNKPAGSHFCYKPRLVVGTVKGLLAHLSVQYTGSITVGPLHRLRAKIEYMNEPITQITGLRGPKRQSTSVLAVGQDSSLGGTDVKNQACVNVIEYYGNNKRKCLFVLRPVALQDICEIMSLRLVPNATGYSITIAFRCVKADSVNIVSYNIFKKNHVIKARLNLDIKEDDLGRLWDVYPLENRYLALLEKPLASPSDSDTDVQDSRVILFRPDGTRSQEDMTYHSDDEQMFSRGTSVETAMDLDEDESDTEPEMDEEAPASDQKKPDVEDEETTAVLAEFEESYTVETVDHDMLETEISTIQTRDVLTATTSRAETQDTDDELQKFEEAVDELHDVSMSGASDLEETNASASELFMLDKTDAEAVKTRIEEADGHLEHDGAPQYSNTPEDHDNSQYGNTPENHGASDYDDTPDYGDYQEDNEVPEHDTYDDYRDDEPAVPVESSDAPYTTGDEVYSATLEAGLKDASPDTAGADELIIHREASVKVQQDPDVEQGGDADIAQSDIQHNAESDIEQSKGSDIEQSDAQEDQGLLIEQTEESPNAEHQVSHLVDNQTLHFEQDQPPHFQQDLELHVQQERESLIDQAQATHVQRDEEPQTEECQPSHVQRDEVSQTEGYHLPQVQKDEEPQVEQDEEPQVEQDEESPQEQDDVIAVDSDSEESNQPFAHSGETTPQHDAPQSFNTLGPEEQLQTAYIPSTAPPSLSTDEFQMWSSFVTTTTAATTPSPKMTPLDSEHPSSSPLHLNEDIHTPFAFQNLQQSTGPSSPHGSDQALADEDEPLVNHPIFTNDQPLAAHHLFKNDQSLSSHQPFIAEERPLSEEEPLIEDHRFTGDQHFTEQEYFAESQPLVDDQHFTEEQPHSQEESPIEAERSVEEHSPAEDQPVTAPSPSFADMLLRYPQPQTCREEAVDGELFIDLLLKEIDSAYTNSYPLLNDNLDILLNETPLRRVHDTIACYLNIYDTGDDVAIKPYITAPEKEVNLAIVYWLLDRCLYERAVGYLEKACASTTHDYKIMKTLERGFGCQKAQQTLEVIESAPQQESDLKFRPESWVRFLQETSLPATLTYIKTRIMDPSMSKEYISNILNKLFHGTTAPTMLELKQLAMFEHGKDQRQQLLSFAQQSDTLPAKAFMVCHYIHTKQFGDAVLLNRKIQAAKPATSVPEQDEEIYRECQVLEEKVFDSLPPIARELPAEIFLFPPGQARPPYQNYFREHGLQAGIKLFGEVVKGRLAKMRAEKRPREQDDEEGRECTKAHKL